MHRVMLKLSGEALAGEAGFGIDPAVVSAVVNGIADAVAQGLQLGIVIGGGNIFRGVSASARGMDRATADHMGMLATVMNALALQDGMARSGLDVRVMSALPVAGVAEPFVRRRALRHLDKSRIVVFAGGIGNPYFTTDTAACVRAIDIAAEVVLKATKVDGVYNADPMIDPTARKYSHLTYDRVLAEGLAVMDATAIVMCKEHNLPIRVFNMTQRDSLLGIVLGDEVGTYIGASQA